MAKRWFWLVVLLLAVVLCPFPGGWAKSDFFKIEDLRPGMKGIGKTCYEGTKPEEFQVEILGVLHGVNPGADAVLARFSGNRLDKVGIFEGMSGSPVFIDGKLLGAVAYSYTFAKEAIGGITPITQMVDAFKENEDFPSGIPLKKSRLWNYRLPIPATGDKSLAQAFILNGMQLPQSRTTFNGHSLIPIATPLNMGGFHPEALKMFAPQFRAVGMSMLQGTGGSTLSADSGGIKGQVSPPFEAGSNIVVSLVQGDMEVSAGGTVTYIDGDRLYAFGHNFMELGYTELPMQKAKAITVFPSLESSFKILEAGAVVGTIRQDRGMGIYGIVGERPRMIPMQVELTTSRGVRKTFKYELAHDSLLTPLLVNLTVYNTIIASERAQGAVTLKVSGKINIKNEEAVEVYGRFSSDSDAASPASLAFAVPVNYLMTAGYQALDLQSLNLEISVQEKDQTAVLDYIRLDRTEVKAGESLEIAISCMKSNGEVIRDIYPVRIPADASPGALTLLVADGATLMALDEQEEGSNLIPRDLTQLIRYINNLRKNDRLYLRFSRRAPGAIIKGEGLPGLPPSILSILKSDRKDGALNAIHTSTLMEYELPTTEYVVAGSKTLSIRVKP
jgi:hypothetical protein